MAHPTPNPKAPTADDGDALGNPDADQHRALLNEAGYAHDVLTNVWWNERLNRGLDAAIAATLTRDQIRAWIADRSRR